MLGMNFTQLETDWPRVDWVRIWDIGCDWSRIQSARHEYDWTRLDAVVGKAEAVGAKIVYVMHGTPRFLAENPNNDHTAPWMPPGSNSIPKDVDVWNEFAWEVASRYKGRIHAYEIGNELQLADFLHPWNDYTRGVWARMTKRAYRTIKAVDPDALVIGASVLPRKSSGGMKRGDLWLSALKKEGWPVDAMACHIYPTVGENYPEWAAYFQEVKSSVKAKGGPSKVWVTETLFDLLGPPMTDAKSQNITRKVREKHAGYVFFYAYDRPDLGGQGPWIKPGTLTWSELEKFRTERKDDDDNTTG